MRQVSRFALCLAIGCWLVQSGCSRGGPAIHPVAGAGYAPLEGLAAGSEPAQERQRRCADRLHLALEIENSVGMRFRLIPPGQFLMGCPPGEPGTFPHERPLHPVRIRRAFYIGAHEVTREQWSSVMDGDPTPGSAAGPDTPVEGVGWADAEEFVARLCERERVDPGTYRLPTEAEWEYACRAGTIAAVYTGAVAIEAEYNAPAIGRIGWYGGNSAVDNPDGFDSTDWVGKEIEHDRAGPQPVGQLPPNGWGLYDTIGGVWEWCTDWIGPYPALLVEDPMGPDAGELHVSRGGSWLSPARRCRAAMRGAGAPDAVGLGLGLRVVREIPSP